MKSGADNRGLGLPSHCWLHLCLAWFVLRCDPTFPNSELRGLNGGERSEEVVKAAFAFVYVSYLFSFQALSSNTTAASSWKKCHGDNMTGCVQIKAAEL